MAIHIKRVLYSCMFLLAVFSVNGAYCQSPEEPKLTVGNVSFSPMSDGFYYANVVLTLTRGPNNPQVSFNVSVQRVRSLDEVYDKLRPAVDDLANELKATSAGFHPPR